MWLRYTFPSLNDHQLSLVNEYKLQEDLHIHRLLIPKPDDRIRLLVHFVLIKLFDLLLTRYFRAH